MNITEMWNLNHFYSQQEEGGDEKCDEMSLWQHISIPVSEILLLINSSSNFFVYMFFDKGFQLVLKQKFVIFECLFKTSDASQPESVPLKQKPRITQKINENDERINQVEEKEVKNIGNTETVLNRI